jgi:hypothetical protein
MGVQVWIAGIVRDQGKPSSRLPGVARLVRFAFAARMPTSAIDVRRVLHGFTLRAAILSGLYSATAWRVLAFVHIFHRHRFLSNKEGVSGSGPSSKQMQNQRNHRKDQQ